MLGVNEKPSCEPAEIPKVCTWGEHEPSRNRQNKDRAIDSPLGG